MFIQATLLFSVRTESRASSQRVLKYPLCSVNIDATVRVSDCMTSILFPGDFSSVDDKKQKQIMSVTNMDTSIKPDVKSTRSEELANPEKRISLQVKYYNFNSKQ